MDKQDGHVPGGEQKEVDGLMNLGFFMDMYVGTQGSGRTEENWGWKKWGVEKECTAKVGGKQEDRQEKRQERGSQGEREKKRGWCFDWGKKGIEH